VLERPWHLSYPQVFAQDGDIWMLPEASASGALTLYRCRTFPDRWEAAATLLHEAVHDATHFARGGRLWITAATAGWQASSWDTLALYSAERLAGPWLPHAANPVLTDVAAARPAGVPFVTEGRLVRPVQDCSGGYGSALGLVEVTRLDDEAFAQRPLARWRFDASSALHGPHTFNRVPGLEILDLFGRTTPGP
jgi:hypothetical protein